MSQLMIKSRIGSMTLKNRIIMTAIHTGFSMEKEIAFLERRAAGGAAAVTAVMGVSGTGASVNMSVLELNHKDALMQMADAVHRRQSKLLIQLFHAGRNGAVGLLADPEAYPVAPSPIPSPIYKEVPRELAEPEIKEIVREFGRAAALCKAAGVDGVEISCSAGYLLSQFFSPLTNRRTDRYGGDLERRMIFPMEVIREVRDSVGSDYPVILRVSAADMLGGYGIADTIVLVAAAEPYLDAVNVTGGWHESEVPQISMFLPEGGFAFLAKEVKKHVKIPVIACNRINNEEVASEILEQKYADFVGCARAFLADSDFAKKIEQGIPYRRCIGCNKGCIEKVLKMQPVACIFNPETESGNDTETIRSSGRRTLVIGGGPAGIEAALQCAKRGDEVKLCTDDKMIGGLLHVAAKAPFKDTIARNIKTLRTELEHHHVEVNCGVSVDQDYIERENPDFVIVATGSKPIVPPIPGVNRRHVFTAQQVLNAGESTIKAILKGKVLIIGGGSVGLETALFLASKMRLTEAGTEFLTGFAGDSIREGLISRSEITVVEMTGSLGSDMGGLLRTMLRELMKRNVEMITNSRVEEILTDKVIFRTESEQLEMETDTVVLAAGYSSRGKSIIDWLEISRKYQYCVIGDAAKVGNIKKAIEDACEHCR